jgi:protein-L-isoaspartate(D-aspartate) O-methyltransferase
MLLVMRIPFLEHRGESDPDRASERAAMVERQLARRGIVDPRVLHVMRSLPRHHFVPSSEAPLAYDDQPVPIGHGQTVSQPYIVGFMSQALELGGGERVLEIGSGSGYQTAVLALLAREVVGLEIVPELAERACRALAELGLDNARILCRDGSHGLPEEAPFDAILAAAAPREVPEAWIDQLTLGGRLVMPIGKGDEQELVLVRRAAAGAERRVLLPVRFVPMTGEAGRP